MWFIQVTQKSDVCRTPCSREGKPNVATFDVALSCTLLKRAFIGVLGYLCLSILNEMTF